MVRDLEHFFRDRERIGKGFVNIDRLAGTQRDLRQTGVDFRVRRSEDADGIAAFLAENGFTYPVLMDTDNLICNTLGVEAFPTSWFFAPDGTLVSTEIGAMDRETMIAEIESALGK